VKKQGDGIRTLAPTKSPPGRRVNVSVGVDSPPTQAAELVAAYLHAQGQSLATIGERFGAHAKTVAVRLRDGGVALRPRRGRV